MNEAMTVAELIEALKLMNPNDTVSIGVQNEGCDTYGIFINDYTDTGLKVIGMYTGQPILLVANDGSQT